MTEQPAGPQDDIKALSKLLGTWQVSGGAVGTVRYQWLEGGYFLIQHIDLTQFGARVQGIEIIGHEQPFGQAASAEIKSRYYDSQGNTFDYVYELDGESLTIWAGEKGSPAHFKGTFAEGGNSCSGAWVYPGGGGYDSVMTRVAGEG